ncbi:phage tail collar domain-containing protein [Caballeronia peredens]|nr:phage tail collar domain-containing protein [Caballeronia peredens]
MQANQSPALVTLPFATNGLRNAIPEGSQTGIKAGAASLNDGFPPLTMQPKTQGGVPPDGRDFNGILFLLSAVARWMQAGASFIYDPAFASNPNLGGYPKGAMVLRADFTGFWFNTADNNTTNPDATDGSSFNWLALNADWNATSGPGVILNKPAIQAPLGFTPVQQGGGVNQAVNKVYVGWRSDGSGLGVTVDQTDLGNVVFASQLAGAIPVGTLLPFAGVSVPAGFLLANGAVVSRTAFAALFAVIGGIYGGGDGATTFNLPDTRGVDLRGVDNGRGLDPGRTLGSYQSDSLASHGHGVGDPGHGHGVSDLGTATA